MGQTLELLDVGVLDLAAVSLGLLVGFLAHLLSLAIRLEGCIGYVWDSPGEVWQAYCSAAVRYVMAGIAGVIFWTYGRRWK